MLVSETTWTYYKHTRKRKLITQGPHSASLYYSLLHSQTTHFCGTDQAEKNDLAQAIFQEITPLMMSVNWNSNKVKSLSNVTLGCCFIHYFQSSLKLSNKINDTAMLLRSKYTGH